MNDAFAFIDAFINFWVNVIDELNKYPIDFNGIQVTIPALFFAGLVISIVITVLWKGAKA